jgi:hypothetical protein
MFLITALKTLYLVKVILFRWFVFMCDFLGLHVFIHIHSRIQRQNPVWKFQIIIVDKSYSILKPGSVCHYRCLFVTQRGSYTTNSEVNLCVTVLPDSSLYFSKHRINKVTEIQTVKHKEI